MEQRPSITLSSFFGGGSSSETFAIQVSAVLLLRLTWRYHCLLAGIMWLSSMRSRLHWHHRWRWLLRFVHGQLLHGLLLHLFVVLLPRCEEARASCGLGREERLDVVADTWSLSTALRCPTSLVLHVLRACSRSQRVLESQDWWSQGCSSESSNSLNKKNAQSMASFNFARCVQSLFFNSPHSSFPRISTFYPITSLQKYLIRSLKQELHLHSFFGSEGVPRTV